MLVKSILRGKCLRVQQGKTVEHVSSFGMGSTKAESVDWVLDQSLAVMSLLLSRGGRTRQNILIAFHSLVTKYVALDSYGCVVSFFFPLHPLWSLLILGTILLPELLLLAL